MPKSHYDADDAIRPRRRVDLMPTGARPQLLGFWMCVALVVGNTIGSGIFMLPASIAPYGLNSLIGWAFTTCGALVLAVVFARLSRAIPEAGGPYAYVRLAFGPFPAFIVAWGYWISVWVGNVSIATGTVSYLSSLLPWIARVPGASAAVTLLLLWSLTLVNWYGVKAAGWVQSVTTVLKILPLLAVIVLGLAVLRPAAVVASSIPITLDGTTASATLTLWALLGLESATVPASKVRDPSRTIPRATLVGTLATALICVLACTTVILLLPQRTLATSDAPFVDLVTQYWGGAAGKAVAVLAAISGFGALNGWILLQGEMPNVMAKNGVFPSVFAQDSPRGTPSFALWFSSALVTVLVLMNHQKSMVSVFTFMILLSTTACLVTYLLCSLALLRLQYLGRFAGTYRAGGLALVGTLGALYSLWAIVGAGSEAVIWGFVLLALGAPLYLAMRRRRWRSAHAS